MKKKVIALLLAAAMAMSLTACGDTSKTGSTAEETAKQEETTKESENTEKAEESTLVYGSGDYTRINPAMDEHCEINVLLFSGLTAHDADDQVIPGLAGNMMRTAILIRSISVMGSNGMTGKLLLQMM